jgi:hypothetical protein
MEGGLFTVKSRFILFLLRIIRFYRVIVVYYESIKRDLKTKLIYECRYDERLKTKVEESTHLGYTVLHDKTN